ncbi:Chromo domain-containing protein 2 [Madurella mycetomatis]|uniref:Chromo domain-containing protein 2 n=1 Tax=Madurella mycetomatis TaxID=100816 RepID=A0A150ASK6_9PEZI|nr:Chromo domain-containing protein 2 [Madurella mycetomatis]
MPPGKISSPAEVGCEKEKARVAADRVAPPISVIRDGFVPECGFKVGPAISDNEEEFDDKTKQSSAATKSGRGRKSAYQEEDLEEDDVSHSEEKNGDAGDGEEEEDDEDGEDDEDDEVYVVEKIMSHMIDKTGKPLFEVKWEGYEKKSDRTWEPEENLAENASEVLNEYLESIGGRDRLLADTENALKSKKRSRPSLSTPQASGKRSKKNSDHPAESEPPRSAKAASWKPPPGSWEDHIAQLDACEDEESGKLMVYLTWKNGHKTQHETQVIYQRCPQKMLQFYERHVRIIKRDPDADSVTTPS